MTMETTRAPDGAKPASPTANRGTASTSRPGAVGAPGAAGAGGGFAGLMSLLSAADAQSAPLEAVLPETTTALTLPVPAEDQEDNMPLALDIKGLIAIDLITMSPPIMMPAMLPTGSAPPADTATLTTSGPAPVAAALAASKGSASVPSGPEQATTSFVATVPNGQAPEAAAAPDVASLLDHRRASQSHAAAQTQFELRDARLQPANQPALVALDAGRAATAVLTAEALSGAIDRREGRPGSGSLRTGLEGALGGTVADRLGINPSYEVAAATAVVPEGQVAETVSYWASHGVQSAELTLDGLGDEPVEVRISLEGDQAQIDFRSNQPEVRQALESASEQLKTLLSGEGLQLTGMSVGTSGRGAHQSEGGQSKPSARQAKLVSLEPTRSTHARAANPAVGQALDLYV